MIAFAVDFSNGTIYLPRTSLSALDMKNIKQVKFDPRTTDKAGIERIVMEQTGHAIKLDQSNLTMTRLSSSKEMLKQLACELHYITNGRIALNSLKGETK